jgi:hypothetical protein
MAQIAPLCLSRRCRKLRSLKDFNRPDDHLPGDATGLLSQNFTVPSSLAPANRFSSGLEHGLNATLQIFLDRTIRSRL